MPQIVLHDKTNNIESDVESSDESVCEMESVCENESLHDDTESEINLTNGDYVIVKYAGKRRKLYSAAVVNEVHADEDMHVVAFFKCNGKYVFLFDEKDTDEVGVECILAKLPAPEIKQKLDVWYYYVDFHRDLKLE